MTKRFIPVSAPMLVGNEKKYVLDCLETTWISSSGKYLERFEAAFAEFCGARHAIACCNGTVVLHLALLALGVEPGDEVIVPTLTYVATANAVTYCGAQPIFVDAEPVTWNLDPAQIKAKLTPRTKGIIAVHLYGHPVEMDTLREIARQRSLFIIEDAAEAHGAEYKGRRVGALGEVGTFSFYGNKIITTGEGGMLVTDHDGLAAHLRQLKGQGMDPQRRYWFPTVGYNYRMTNVAAAMGLAQLEQIEWHMQRRREVAAWYGEELRDLEQITWQPEQEWARHAYWMFTVGLREASAAQRDEVMRVLLEQGIETRPVFYPMHQLPIYQDAASADAFPVADQLARQGINLPTWAGLTREDVRYIGQCLREALQIYAKNAA